MAPISKNKKQSLLKESSGFGFESMFSYVHNNVKALNDSKIFAGIMIIIINIASKFVTFKVSKTVESYLKFNFSRDILVFAITWMGTRDIYIAIVMTCVFIFIADFLLNENSMLCCLPKSFVTQQVAKLNEPAKTPTQEEVIKAQLILAKAGTSQQNELADAQLNPTVYKESFTTGV
jgi:hypothetical protein